MKKLTSTFLAVLMSFYGIIAMTPALAVADNGNHNGWNKSSQETKSNESGENENHGSVVSAAARSHSEDEGENHGSMVSAVAKDNHGHEDKNNNEDHENNNHHNDGDDDEDDDNDNGSATTTLAISNVTASSTGTTSEAIVWDTNRASDSKVYYSTSSPVVIGGSNTSLVSSGSMVSHHVMNLTGLTSGVTYYFVAVSSESSSSTATSSQSQFTVQTPAPADTTAPSILFATNIGSSASTTSLIWVTNESSDSKVWFGTTTPVSTSTAPMVSSGIFSFFHQLSLPSLATSTLYYFTIGSTDSSGNTGYYSASFTTPSTL